MLRFIEYDESQVLRLLQFERRAELNDPFGRHLNGGSRAGVATGAGRAQGHREGPQAGQGEFIPLQQGLNCRADHGIHCALRCHLADIRLQSDRLDQLCFIHRMYYSLTRYPIGTKIVKKIKDSTKGGKNFLFRRFVVQDMGRDSGGQQQEEEAQSPMVGHPEGAVEQGEPHKTHRDDLHPQRDGAMLPKVADIGPQARVIQKPLVEPIGTAEVECSGQQKKGCSGEDRQKDTDHTQRQGEASQDGQQGFHGDKDSKNRARSNRYKAGKGAQVWLVQLFFVPLLNRYLNRKNYE